MLQVELKKILFHHKGLLLLLISLAAYAVFCVGSGYDSSYVIDRNEDTYLAYMDRWQGEVTEEKAQEMEAEYAEATRSDDGRKAAFLTIYNQYYYAKEDPAHRFLMDERGWDTLLTHDGVNVILLLFLLALCVPVFCGEYQCGMAQILRSCRNGRGRLAGIKLGSLAALAVLATALFQLVQFVVVALSVGLDGASYPLQSLSFFEHSPYSHFRWAGVWDRSPVQVLGGCLVCYPDCPALHPVPADGADYIFRHRGFYSATFDRRQLSQICPSAPGGSAGRNRLCVGDTDRGWI